MVGSGDPIDEALKVALDRHGLFVEAVPLEELRGSVQLTAPDLILLLGDAAEDGGVAALTVLGGDASSAAVPVVLLAPDARLESRMYAFRHGAMAVVPRSASADAVARKVAGLSKELSTHFEEKTGEIGEATFDELVDLVKKELRSGILSVHAPNHKGGPMRVVLGAGRPVAQAVQEFVARLKPHIAAAGDSAMYYQFHTSAGGPVELLDMDGAGGDVQVLRELRILLVDDDPARADTLAQELRARGAIVFVTDTHGRGLERAVGLDPQVAIVDAAGLEGPGFEVVRSLRKDLRLRWASILIAPWDEIWPRGAAMPDIEKLASRMEPLLVPERDLTERAGGKEAFDLRLESMGPGRMLRILVESGATFHVTVRNPKAVVQVDLAQGLLVGAQARTKDEQDVEGTAALAALLSLGSGRVHVERRANPAFANVMTPVDEALSVASTERSVVPLSTPPESGGRALPRSALPEPKRKAQPAAGASHPEPEPPPASGDMKWGNSGDFPVIGDDDDDGEEVSAQTQIKDLAGLAMAGEAFLDESARTVRPPEPHVPPEAVPTPKPPPPVSGGPVSANERTRPARRRRSTLVMGAPTVPDAPPAPSAAIPPKPPGLQGGALPPEPPGLPGGALPAKPPSGALPPELPAAAPPEEPPALSDAGVDPNAASEPADIGVELPSELEEIDALVAEAPAGPAAVFEDAAGDPEVSESPSALLTPVASSAPVPASVVESPPRRGFARTLGTICVVAASVVLVAVLGLIGYSHSGWHRPELDRALVLLGAAPAATRGGSTDTLGENGEADAENHEADPENHQADPENHQPDPENHQADPENRQADPENRQADPENRQADPENRQADPENRQADPENRQADPENRQADPENGPADTENGPADTENGPADTENGPADTENGPADTENGPADTENGPADTENGPAADEHDEEGTDVDDLLRRARSAGNDDLSERLYRRILQLDEHEHHAMVGLARILMDRGENDEAATLFRGAVRRRPRRAIYRVWLGDARAGSGDTAGARREWQRALELDPDNRLAQQRLGQ